MTTISVKNISKSDIELLAEDLRDLSQEDRNAIANESFSAALRKTSTNLVDVTTFNPEALKKQFDIIND